MRNKAALSALLGVLAEQVYAQGRQCGSNRWGIQQKQTDCWLKWSGWSECAGHCGQSTQTATRKCRGNIPGMGGCQGSELRRQRCRDNQVVQGKSSYCPYWSFWSEWGGCQVQKSDDPCIINKNGWQMRTRTCHDPYASERGETPQCQGDELERKPCTSNYQAYTPSLPSPAYIEGEWGLCSVQCGDGVEQCEQTHVCANRPGTWVPQNEWYRIIERPCQRACCQPEGDRQVDEQNDPCNGGFRVERQYFRDYYGGCEKLAQTTQPNLRRVNYGYSVGGAQWVDEIRVDYPVAYPQPPIQFCQETRWGLCTAQDFLTELIFAQAANAQEIMTWLQSGLIASERPLSVQKLVGVTTAAGNGLKSRVLEHCCAQPGACNAATCPTWQSPPYTVQEQVPCGEPAVLQFKCDDSFDVCQPKCFIQFVDASNGQVLQINEVACGLNPGCGVQPSLPMPFPVCQCNAKDVTRQQQCQPLEVKTCPAHQITEQMGEWIESTQLIEFRNRGQCVCQQWDGFQDQRWKTVIEIAPEDPNNVCSRTQVEAGTRINSYAKLECWGAERCEMNTCDDTICGDTYNCYQTDECSGTPRVTSRKPCPLNPNKPNPCCQVTPWKIIQDCSNSFMCPRDAIDNRRKSVRYIVNKLTGKEDAQCKFADGQFAQYMDAECPAVPCPDFSEWTAWSQCSNIIDGCHCGGNRQRSRQHPCGTEGADNQGCPAVSSVFSEFDSWTPQHHSQFCHDAMMTPPNFGSDLCLDVSVGEWERDTCVSESSYRMIRKTTTTHVCPGVPAEVTIDEKIINVPCIDTPLPTNQALPNCADTNNDQSCCQYSADGCSAEVFQFCISQDPICQAQNKIKVSPASAIQCPISNPVVREIESECLPRGPETTSQLPYYSLETALVNTDVCVGVCKLTSEHKCLLPGGTRLGAVREVACDLATRNPQVAWNTFQCSSWTDFLPVQPFVDPSKTEQRPIQPVNGYQSVMVQCDVCGGKLVSSRKCPCVLNNNVFETKQEFKEIECPKPDYYWGEWTSCPACIANKADKYATRSRQFVAANPMASHCMPPKVETEKCPAVPPCRVPCPSRVDECRYNAFDRQANCGKGRMFNITTVYQCDYEGNRLSETGIEQDPVDLRVECDLPYQRVLVPTQQYGCETLQEQCEGGKIFQNQVMKCIEPDTRNPYGYIQEPPTTIVIGECPAKPIVDVITERGTCGMCDSTTVEVRRCIGGTFQDSCQCQGFGRECCVRDPSYTLNADGTESKIVPCPPAYRPPVMVNVTHPPNCDCDCTELSCPQDVCTQQIDYNSCTVIKQGYNGGGYHQIEILPLSECEWSPSIDPLNKCIEQGWQNYKCIHNCLNNTRLNPPHVKIEKINKDTSFVTFQGIGYDRTNSFFADQLKTCKYEIQRRTERSECDYSNPCAPVALVTVIDNCQGAEVVNRTYTESCPYEQGSKWTAWSQCSVECGQGQKTRQLIENCSGNVLQEETMDCGCPISRWSEWSDWVGVCQECGPELQQRTQSRTCVEPQPAAIDTVAGQYVTYMSNGLFRSRLNSVVDTTCADKCNSCVPDVDGSTTIRTMQFRRDDECRSPLQTVTDQCPTDKSVCSGLFYQRSIHCGKEVDKQLIRCPIPMLGGREVGPCMDSNGQEITTCGEGMRTITTFTDLCSPPITIQEPCVGPYGRIVQKVVDEACTATCGGGVKVYRQISQCEQLVNGAPYVIDSLTRTRTETCGNIPCAYWLGWSSWTQCSTTCGAGQRQRTRRCSGGSPGDGGCLPLAEWYKPVGAVEEVEFTPVANGAVHTEPCSDGDCCNLKWSGWSNCCIHTDQTRKRIKHLVNRCTGENTFKTDVCNSQSNSVPASQLQTCLSVFGQSTSIATAWQQSVQWGSINRGWDVTYGRKIDNGLYTIASQSYRLVNSADGKQVWYLVQPDLTEVIVDVEVYDHQICSTCQTTYYYRFGSNWYKYSNGQFNVQISSPPQYVVTTTAQEIVTENPVTSYTTYYPSYANQIQGGWNMDTKTQQLYKAPMSQNVVAGSTQVSSWASASASANGVSASATANASSNLSFKNEADTQNSNSLFAGGNF